MRHGIDLKPIHNVKCAGQTPATDLSRIRFLFISGIDRRAADNRGKRPAWWNSGGAYRDRTDDPLLAKQVLSQLS